MIKPGLQRISQLVNGSALPWKAVHVAGTNGKGTVCAATAALLTAARIRTGLFMSPHLLDRWDGIQVDGEAVSESAFRDAEARVAALDGAGAADRPSAFERLTATAFDVFSQRRVDVAVVETGMGGRFDATNVLQAPLVTVITKIGQDHQAFLGHTIEEIAWHKAGIMKPGVPCVLDGSSGEAAVDVVRRVAHKTGAGPLHVCGMRTEQGFGREQDVGLEPDLEPFQRANLSCALKAAEIVLAGLQPQTRIASLVGRLRHFQYPGRLQFISLAAATGHRGRVLLDGAHNAQAAQALAPFVARHVRQARQPVTWLLAVSRGRPVADLARPLVQAGDGLCLTEYGPVDGMPWVRPMDGGEMLAALKDSLPACTIKSSKEPRDGLQAATEMAAGNPIVITGSLYLASAVLRLVK